MRLKAIVPAAALCLAAILPTVPARAATSFPGAGPCPVYGGVQICSGEVPSWDGSPMDVDLSLPTTGGGQHPLMVMLHGFGNNKHEWESLTDTGDNKDKWHWNSHWFATHGYYVLTYTARGFRDDGPTDSSYQPPTPCGSTMTPACPGSLLPPLGSIHLKSRDYEIKDTQYLAALAAAAYSDINPNQVAVTGGSYGGGEAWTQASLALASVTPTGMRAWSVFPGLPALQLQVSVPKYPWTDLGYSLAPNGHKGPFQSSIYTSSTGSPNSDTGQGNPLGVIKYSYASGFFTIGSTQGAFETVPEPIPAWYADAVGVGDPYDAGTPGTDRPTIAQVRQGLTEVRSSYYQDEYWAQQVGNREVAVFSVSGWTDDLFPSVESFRQFKYLKALDSQWPVELVTADVGHPRAQNPAWEWQAINDRAWTFLGQQIQGSHPQDTQVTSFPTICPGSAGQAEPVTASTPEGLAAGSLVIAYPRPGILTNRKPLPFPAPDPLDLDNMRTDPAFGSAINHYPPCRESVAPTAPPFARYTGYSAPLSSTRTYVGLGYVHLHYLLVGATTATLNARVWDVPPNGKALLVTRGTYRIDGTLIGHGYDALPVGTIDVPLFGNQWTLAAGHKVRLDLTQVDYPTFLPSNSLAAVISFPSARLVLPTREG